MVPILTLGAKTLHVESNREIYEWTLIGNHTKNNPFKLPNYESFSHIPCQIPYTIMPHQFGLPGFAQTPPSPPSQHGALLPRIGGGGAVVPGSTGGSMTTNNNNNSNNANIPIANNNNNNNNTSQQQQQQQLPTALVPTGFRTHIEDKKLTKDAMERYMRERNDMVIVILHAKVSVLRLTAINIFVVFELIVWGCNWIWLSPCLIYVCWANTI